METMRKAPGSPASRAPIDRQAIERKAIDYLGRYEAPAARVTAVLRRMVDREARRQSLDREAAFALIDMVVADLAGRGLIADRRYAEIRLRVLRERGMATGLIRQDLGARGIAAAVIDELLEAAGSGYDDDLAAAIAFARRRRLGPFRQIDARPGNRLRDLAALARRGFGSDIARRVVDAIDAAALIEREEGD